VARGAAPHRTRPRERRRRLYERVHRIAEHVWRRIDAELCANRRVHVSRHYAYRRAETHAVENVFTVFAPADAPLTWTRCETSKVRLRVFNATLARGRPVYVAVREARSILVRITRYIRYGLEQVRAVVVRGRRAAAVIRDYMNMTMEAVEHYNDVEDRKPLNATVEAIFKLVDAFASLSQTTRWGATVAEAAVDDNTVMRGVYAERGCVERVHYATDRCTAVYLARWSGSFAEPFAYWARKITDRVMREELRRVDDPVLRQLYAQWLKDALMACDAETRDAWGHCVTYALRMARRKFSETGYGRAYARMRGS